MQNVQIATLVENFAKANKASREKLTKFANDVVAVVQASAPSVNADAQPARVIKMRSRAKRSAAHAQILNFANENGGIFTRAQIESIGVKSVAFACKTLEQTGQITRLAEETKSGEGRGRGSVTYKLVA